VLGAHRDRDAAAQPGAEPVRAVLDARVDEGVLRPHGLARLKRASGQPCAGPKGHFARALDELAHLRLIDAPGIAEAKQAFIDPEVAPARPAFAFAHRADHAAQAARGVLGFRKRARYLLLESHQLLRALLHSDVAPDAAP